PPLPGAGEGASYFGGRLSATLADADLAGFKEQLVLLLAVCFQLAAHSDAGAGSAVAGDGQ
ncbi:MAG: hypothetical protein AB7K36_20990, partial [Chloroflexota bacterium]